MLNSLIPNCRALFYNAKDKELYRFLKSLNIAAKDLRVYRTALIHKSAPIKSPSNVYINNERLEFLGDSILDAVISEYLYRQYPERNEGFLTNMKSKIVNRDRLNDIASNLNLQILIVSNLNREKCQNYLGNALEALIAAMYLDKGYRFTRKYILDHFLGKYIDIDEVSALETNYKSKLIEWCQKYRKTIRFESTENSTARENGMFVSIAMVSDEPIAKGYGNSKKEAEQQAARAAYLILAEN